jgi:hypothetical protein
MKLGFAALAIAFFIGGASTAIAQTVTVYNSVPNPIPPNVASEGPEAYSFSQLGDGLALAGAVGGKLDTVTVVMASWACQSGTWYAGTCVTKAGATYSMPITVNVYSVVSGTSLQGASLSPAPGTLLATMTQTFALPYRPSTSAANCTGGAWYDAKAETCFNGIAAPITFNLSSLKVTLPSQIIVGVVYNTSDYGPSPYGDGTACHATTQGCFYDSLNISTDSNEGFYQAIGSVLDVDGIFVDYTNAANSCNASATIDVFGLDASPGCWTGYHPELKVTAQNPNKYGHAHGDRHNGVEGPVY